MKKFYVLLVCCLFVFFTGCTTTVDQEKKELETKISELEERISEFEQTINQKNEELAEKNKEIEKKNDQIASLTEQVNELLQELNKKPIVYTISIYDIDGEELGNEQIIGAEGDKLIDALEENFEVETKAESWGTVITSINGSIVDPNYYLACYENEEYAQVGADELVLENNDQIKYVNECWNQDFDSVDLAVDQLIYGLMKDSVRELFEKVDPTSKTPFYDYYLTPAILMMMKLGYDENIFNFNFSNAAAVKEALESKDWQAETVQNNFMKGGISLIALNGNLTSFKEALNAQTRYNYWQAVVTKALKIENEILTSTIEGWTPPTAAGDLSMMAIPAYSLYMTKEQIGMTAIDATYAALTPTGVNSFGINGASTAQFILGLGALGLNPREYQVAREDQTMTDAIEILTTYGMEGGFKNRLTDAKADLGFTTPQAMAALLSYKAMRDLSLSAVNCFSYLGTEN